MSRVTAAAPTMPMTTPTATSRSPVSDRQRQHVARRGAQRDADAQFLRALRDGVREDAVDARRAEQQRQPAEDPEHPRKQLERPEPLAAHLVHRRDREDRKAGIRVADGRAQGARQGRRGRLPRGP